MSGTPYAQVAHRLVERGYAAIPVMPNTKRPGEMRRGEWVGITNWRDEYTRRLPSRFELQIWCTCAGAGVCVVAGPASKHLVGIDIDTDDPIIKAAILSAIPPTTLIKVGAKGETRIFRGPAISRSKSWRGIADLIGPGRQMVLPPSIHPTTGEPYKWMGPDALEDVDPAELPELLPEHVAAIDEALKPFGYAEEEFSVPERGPSSFVCEDKRGREYSLGALHGCADELAQAPPNTRNIRLNNIAYKLARKAARGWLSEDEIAAALWAACLHNGLIADDGAHSVRATLWSGINAGLRVPAPDPRERLTTIDPQMFAGLKPRTV